MSTHQASPSIGVKAAQGLIKLYQYSLSPMLGPRCRFYPSCSAYTAEAIGLYGVRRGSWMGAKRLARCHPWNEGGLDFVPAPSASSASTVSNFVRAASADSAQSSTHST